MIMFGLKRDHAIKIKEAIGVTLTPDQIEAAERHIARWDEANH